MPNAKKFNFNMQPYNNLKQKFPQISDSAFDLLNKLLTYDPAKRLTAAEALNHPWFHTSPPPKDPDLMPTWPSAHGGGGVAGAGAAAGGAGGAGAGAAGEARKKRRPSHDEEMQRERDIADSRNDEERFVASRDRSYSSSSSKPFVLK